MKYESIVFSNHKRQKINHCFRTVPANISVLHGTAIEQLPNGARRRNSILTFVTINYDNAWKMCG
jgi:hypothetical protein